MSTTLAPIAREVLQEKIERGDDLVLVDALSPMSYAMSHLPGAISMPPEGVDERAPRQIPDLDTEIVVYCESVSCDSSTVVASRLLALGYRNVWRYAGGKRDWVRAGLPLESHRANH